MKYQKRKNLAKIPPRNPLALNNDLPMLKPLYLNVRPGSKLLRRIAPDTQQENTNMPDIAPTNTNTDIPQVTTRTRRKRTTTAQPPLTSGSGASEAKPSATRVNTRVRINSVKLKAVTDGVTSLYATVGIFAYARDPYDGLVIMTTAQQRAVELVNVAKHHKWLMDLLVKLTQSSDYVTLAVGHATLAYAILSHHNQIPKNDALLTQFNLSEQQVFTAAAAMQAQQENATAAAAQAQAQEMDANPDLYAVPEASPYDGIEIIPGQQYDTNTNGSEEPGGVHRMDESVLEPR